MNKIYNSDSLEFLKTREEFEFDLNYCDPPYALGSEVIIRADGRVDYKNAVDFMNKWDMPTGDYWEEWFKEAYRTLKYGGTLIMFGMDRQLLMFKYYAQMAGFIEQQSMYWYYISGFPKATDLSKRIDSYLTVGKGNMISQRKNEMSKAGETKTISQRVNGLMSDVTREIEVKENTKPYHKVAEKYDGYKYSIAPLKQTNETIMVFKKPTKTGSVLHDAIAYENGDNEITVSSIDIDGNRVGCDMEDTNPATNPAHRKLGGYKMPEKGVASNGSSDFVSSKNEIKLDGRYPAQTFVDQGAANMLDEQSGTLAGNNSIGGGAGGIWTKGNKQQACFNDTGGASKILHTIQPDLYHYQPKVNNMERNAGLGDDFTGGEVVRQGLAGENNNPVYKNNHPTLKPIDLNYKVLNLYKTPNLQKIVYPFSGAGSEIIGGLKAGFDNWVGCELSDEFIDIANARIKYWGNNFKHGYTDIKVDKEKNVAEGQVSLFE